MRESTSYMRPYICICIYICIYTHTLVVCMYCIFFDFRSANMLWLMTYFDMILTTNQRSIFCITTFLRWKPRGFGPMWWSHVSCTSSPSLPHLWLVRLNTSQNLGFFHQKKQTLLDEQNEKKSYYVNTYRTWTWASLERIGPQYSQIMAFNSVPSTRLAGVVEVDSCPFFEGMNRFIVASRVCLVTWLCLDSNNSGWWGSAGLVGWQKGFKTEICSWNTVAFSKKFILAGAMSQQRGHHKPQKGPSWW